MVIYVDYNDNISFEMTLPSLVENDIHFIKFFITQTSLEFRILAIWITINSIYKDKWKHKL